MYDKLTKRAVVYFDPEMYETLKFKVEENPKPTLSRAISRLVHEALLDELARDEECIKACDERRNEPSIPFEEAVRELKADGKV